MNNIGVIQKAASQTFGSRRIVWSFIVFILALFSLFNLPSGWFVFVGLCFASDGIASLIEALMHPMGVNFTKRIRFILKSLILAFVGIYLIKIGGVNVIYFGEYDINWLYISIALGSISGFLNLDRSMERVKRQYNLPKVNAVIEDNLERHNIDLATSLNLFAIKSIINSYSQKRLQRIFQTPLMIKTRAVNIITTYWSSSPGTFLEEAYQLYQGNASLLFQNFDWEYFNSVLEEVKKGLDSQDDEAQNQEILEGNEKDNQPIKFTSNETNSNNYLEIEDELIEIMNRKQSKLGEVMESKGVANYKYDFDNKKILFVNSLEEVVLEYKIILIGSYSLKENSWAWGWSVPIISFEMAQESSKLRSLSELRKTDLYLSKLPFEIKAEDLNYLIADCVDFLEARAFYKAPQDTAIRFWALMP